MRNISCSHTKEQVRNRTKTVTRRLGWKNLKPGTLLRVVEKAMGLKPGEKIVPLAVVRVVGVRREQLGKMTMADCRKEGFPDYTADDFITMYRMKFGATKETMVTRIEWVYENRCLLCGWRISMTGLCGECTCEEEGL